LLDANRHPRRIDIGDAEVQDLAQPQAGRVGGQDDRAMSEIHHVRDQSLDVRAARNGGERGRTPWRGHAEGHAVACQGRVVEKAERLHDDVAPAPRSPSLANHVQQIRLNLCIRDAVRGSAIELRQPAHGPEIRLTRPIRHPAHLHVIVHLSA